MMVSHKSFSLASWPSVAACIVCRLGKKKKTFTQETFTFHVRAYILYKLHISSLISPSRRAHIRVQEVVGSGRVSRSQHALPKSNFQNCPNLRVLLYYVYYFVSLFRIFFSATAERHVCRAGRMYDDGETAEVGE